MKASRKRTEIGQALVEFALVFLVFMIFLLVIFDLGRAVFYYSAIYNAAREGARQGIVDQNVNDIKDATRRLAAGMDLDPQVTLTNDEVTVRVVYTFTPVSPVLDILLNRDTITLQTQATMSIEK